MGKRRFNYGSSAPSTGSSSSGGVESVVAGSNVTVDNTDPANPVVSAASASASIPQYDSDPGSPAAQDAWVLRTVGATDGDAGQPRGLLLALTYTGEATETAYQFSYRTQQGTTIRTTLT